MFCKLNYSRILERITGMDSREISEEIAQYYCARECF